MTIILSLIIAWFILHLVLFAGLVLIYSAIKSDSQEEMMKLMTAREVRQRLSDGEDPIDLCIEHWFQNAAWIATGEELPDGSWDGDCCALCMVYLGCTGPDFDCPLYQYQGRDCAAEGTAWKQFVQDKTSTNAIAMAQTLVDLKVWVEREGLKAQAEKQVERLYIVEEGVEPDGTVGLKLEYDGYGFIDLVAIDSNDREAIILSFSTWHSSINKKFKAIIHDIPDSFGFPRATDGHVDFH